MSPPGHCHIVPPDQYVAYLQPALTNLEEGVARTPPAERYHSTSPSPSLSLSSLPFVRPFSRPSRTIHPFGVEGNEGEATRSFLECVTFRDEWMEIFFFFSKRRSNEDRVRISSRRPPERERERGIFFLFLKRAERSAATLTASVVITLATLPEVTSTG